MKNEAYDFDNILELFLNRWDYESVQNMTLEEYVDIKNKDTFCQWVETKTRPLGSIKGSFSIKFGIYKRNDPTTQPSNYMNDEKYSWKKSYGQDRNKAFEYIKSMLLKIIDFSENGNFEEIENINLSDLFKWKIASLYSNGRLIPIFNREHLNIIASKKGMALSKKKKICEIQNFLFESKPLGVNVFDYMKSLYKDFISKDDNNLKNTEAYQIEYFTKNKTIERIHNKIQNLLIRKLSEKYGVNNVKYEDNYVDIKLYQKDYITFYEVKSATCAEDCIREALGQILCYSFRDTDHREKRLVIVGQYPPNKEEREYISYLKKQLNINFDYKIVNLID